MISFHRQSHDTSGPSAYTTASALGHTANGTPLGHVVYANVRGLDPLKWIMIPTHWGEAFMCEGPDDFAETEAKAAWGLWKELNPEAKDPGPLGLDRTRVEFKYYAEKFGGFDPMRPFEVTTYLHLPSPTVSALPVKIYVDDTPDLTVEMAALVVDPDAIEAPVMEKFGTAALGEGIKATRHGVFDPEFGKDPDERGVWVAVRYAFAVPGRQAVVTVVATHTDLGRMAAAQSDLDEFVNTINLKMPAAKP
jgi:hypothetical protein